VKAHHIIISFEVSAIFQFKLVQGFGTGKDNL